MPPEDAETEEEFEFEWWYTHSSLRSLFYPLLYLTSWRFRLWDFLRKPPSIRRARVESDARKVRSRYDFPRARVEDLVGRDKELRQVTLSVRYHVFRDKEIRRVATAPPPKLFVIKGGSGTGKTVFAEALMRWAFEEGLMYGLLVEYNSLKPEQVYTMWYGQSAARLSGFFESSFMRPSVVLVDEFQAYGRKVTASTEVGMEETRVQTVFLEKIDELLKRPYRTVLFISTTEYETLLEPIRRRGVLGTIDLDVGLSKDMLVKIAVAECQKHKISLSPRTIVDALEDVLRSMGSSALTPADVVNAFSIVVHEKMQLLSDSIQQGKSETVPPDLGPSVSIDDFRAAARSLKTYAEQERTEAAKRAALRVRPRETYRDVGGLKGIKEEVIKELSLALNPDLAIKARYVSPKGFVFHGPPGCVAGDTLVCLEDGRLIRISDIVKGLAPGVYVADLPVFPPASARAVHIYDVPIVYEITTETGKRLTTTMNHPLMTNKGWKIAERLKVGDELKAFGWIPSPRSYVGVDYQAKEKWLHQAPTIPKVWDEALGLVMGIFLAEGSAEYGRIAFTIHKDELDLRRAILETMRRFGVKPTESVYTLKNVRKIRFSNRELSAFFSQYSEKRVPLPVLLSPVSVASSFLRGLFEGDGGVHFRRTQYTRYVYLKSKSRQLLEECQVLLLRWGIVSRIYDGKAGISSLRISRRKNLIKFSENIGFISDRKSARLSAMTSEYVRKPYELDMQFERVKRINKKEGWTRVYDFEIPSTHSFLSNGLLSHNTGKTLLAKAIAHENKGWFYGVNGPSILQGMYGDPEKTIRNIFDDARKHSPAMIFFDEIDSIAPRRGSADPVIDRVTSQLLTEIDGFVPLSGVVVIASTNRLEAMDPALLERFTHRFEFTYPKDVSERTDIIKIHLSQYAGICAGEVTPEAVLDVFGGKVLSPRRIADVINQSNRLRAKELDGARMLLSAKEEGEDELKEVVAIYSQEETRLSEILGVPKGTEEFARALSKVSPENYPLRLYHFRKALEMTTEESVEEARKMIESTVRLGVPEVGKVYGLMAFGESGMGGAIAAVEVQANRRGSGRVKVLGSEVGESVQASAEDAFVFLNSVSGWRYKNWDFYVELVTSAKGLERIPSGIGITSPPISGPSAGMAIAIAMLSAVLGLRPDPHTVATGAITARGEVWPVGGLDYRGMGKIEATLSDRFAKKLLLPKYNLDRLAEGGGLDPLTRAGISTVGVESVLDAAAQCLMGVSDKDHLLHLLGHNRPA